MKRKLLSLLLCAALLLPALGGCAGKGEASPSPAEGEDAPALSLPPAEMLAAAAEPDSTLAGETALAALSFAGDLLRQTEGENRLLSPVSLLCALGMVLSGARGETRRQMEDALGVSGQTLASFLGPWLSALASEEASPLHAADGIWLADKPGLRVSDAFLELNREYYGAGVECCPFDEAALQNINDFVARNTDGMIDRILDRLDPAGVMVLVNALSFEAPWAQPYRENEVIPGEFHPETGEAREVPFLHHGEKLWLADENTTGFLKPYEGGRYAFAALLPAEGLSMEDYLASLTGEKLLGLLRGVQKAEVLTEMPKFEVSCSFELTPALQDLGMTDVFDPARADLGDLGSCDGGNLYVGQVAHKTFLQLDETGTRAGAATGVVVMEASMRLDEPKRVVLDRPFVYLLVDLETSLPLFIGTLDRVE